MGMTVLLAAPWMLAQAGPGPKPGPTVPRMDVPFRLAIASPHVAWGKPGLGRPIRALVVPSVSEGYTLVELAERLSLQLDTVTIDPAWDVNTWTMGTDANYEARNYPRLYGYLAAELNSATPFDVIVLPSLFGWNRLPLEIRQAIVRRVRAGAGLVLVHPTTGIPAADDPKATRPLNNFAPAYEVTAGDDLWRLSPLVDVLSDRLDNRGFLAVRPDAVASGAWSRTGDHFVTRNIPFSTFPATMEHYKYRLAEGALALATGPEGAPIIASRALGRGRVVALGYVNAGLSPAVDVRPPEGARDSSVLGQPHFGSNDHWWEYFYSLLCRSIVWAAKRESGVRFAPIAAEVASGSGAVSLSIPVEGRPGARAEVRVCVSNRWGTVERERRLPLAPLAGGQRLTLRLTGLAPGRHFADMILVVAGQHADWGAASFVIAHPNRILALSTARSFYARGDTVHVRFRTQAKATDYLVQLFDNRGRLLGKASGRAVETAAVATGGVRGTADLTVGNPTTNVGWVRLTLRRTRDGEDAGLDQRQVRVNFAAPDRHFDAYELIMPWYGPPSYQPWTPVLDRQFRRLGVSVMEDPDRNFRLIKEVHAPGLGVYWHYRESYIQQKEKFAATGDKKYLIREPDLSDAAWLDHLQTVVRTAVQKDEGYHPLAYYLADESSLTAYSDPFDFSWSQPTLQQFRHWLQKQYPDLAALNREWGGHFAQWDDVLPLTTQEAQAKGNFAGWMDHRAFMETVFTQAVQVATQAVKTQDPAGRASLSGTQEPGPSNAVNWDRLAQIVDYLQPYSVDDQDELLRTLRPGLLLTGFTGYEKHGAALRFELWHRLLHGQVGASLFWQYTALNPDLTLTEQGRDLQAAVREFRAGGLALLLRGARRENSGIAVHYSLPSVKGEWITDGRIKVHDISVSGDDTSAHLKRFHDNRHGWVQALEDTGYQFDLLPTEQLEAGALQGYHLLLLPDSIALTDQEVVQIQHFVQRGGWVIADNETGRMDGHGVWQPQGRLDMILGSTADPSSAAGQVQAYGAGHGVFTRLWMSDYAALRAAHRQGARQQWLRGVLQQAGAQPVMEVRDREGRALTCTEATAFDRPGERLVTLLPDPGCADAGPVTIRLPQPAYVYELRSHRFLGREQVIHGVLHAGEPAIYALLAAPMPRLEMQLSRSSVRPGATVRLQLSLAGPDQRHRPAETAHLEVINPRGATVGYYGGDVLLVHGRATFTLRLAYNDLPGRWRVIAREPFTGQSVQSEMHVEVGQ